MSESQDSAEQQMVRTVARRYKRDGYRVAVPAEGAPLPDFLQGYVPDLIAERENDHVVIEVKATSALQGANDLEPLAELVSRQPGWRLELVAIPSASVIRPADEGEVASIEHEIHAAMKNGLQNVAFAYAWMTVEVLLRDLAIKNGVKPAQWSATALARQLVYRGIIASDVLQIAERAGDLRNRLLHGRSEMPTRLDVEQLLALAHRLRSEFAAEDAV